MDTYSKLESSIFSIFNSPSWVSEAIPTFPADYDTSGLEEFIRISVIPSGNVETYGFASGVLNIDIFTPYGTGPSRASVLADTLDKHLMKKTILGSGSSSTQLYHSSFSARGRDRENPALARFLYSIYFNFFGE